MTVLFIWIRWYSYAAISDLQSLDKIQQGKLEVKLIGNTLAVGLQHKESVRGQAFQCSYDKQFRFVGLFFFLTPELNEDSVQ